LQYFLKVNLLKRNLHEIISSLNGVPGGFGEGGLPLPVENLPLQELLEVAQVVKGQFQRDERVRGFVVEVFQGCGGPPANSWHHAHLN